MANRFALKAALRDLDEKGIEIGDVVRVSWEVAEQYGGGTRSHVGILSRLDRSDGWFEVSPTNRTPGQLRSALTAMASSFEKLKGVEADEIRAQVTAKKSATTSKPNPFVAKARAQAESKKPTERTASENAAMPKAKPNPFLAKAGEKQWSV